MKTLLIKFGLIFIFLSFIGYVTLVIMGCLTCMFSASENAFCNTYCWIIKIGGAIVFAAWLARFAFEAYKLRNSSNI